ncbi:hypothetical protein H6P81_012904 [Aristolochia fimbriata]|uniref:Uncharacterized protein n=1 Tax=Aristolochia fimbriata TaxID=158543 RepID=A0AAV7EG99_ARIFI|nr:hypothetical protein H6P81_012904 [Aristolochia fimbriata]
MASQDVGDGKPECFDKLGVLRQTWSASTNLECLGKLGVLRRTWSAPTNLECFDELGVRHGGSLSSVVDSSGIPRHWRLVWKSPVQNFCLGDTVTSRLHPASPID